MNPTNGYMADTVFPFTVNQVIKDPIIHSFNSLYSSIEPARILAGQVLVADRASMHLVCFVLWRHWMVAPSSPYLEDEKLSWH
jgi:hypothetical protein